MTHKKIPLLAVEGNAGSGKTTFLTMLSRYIRTELIFEPHTEWQDLNGGNLLELYYMDFNRWAYSFQSYVFITRIQTLEKHLKASSKPLAVLERSVYADKFCFARNCYELGFMSDLEWYLYETWFAWLAQSYVQKPSLFIYLRTSPEVSYARLLKRSRFEEAGVTREYLTSVHNRHEEWLMHKKNVPEDIAAIPVLVIDNDHDFEHDCDLQRVYVQKIVTYLQDHFDLSEKRIIL